MKSDSETPIYGDVDDVDLWEVAPGIVGLKGAKLSLFRKLERRIQAVASADAPEDWLVPAAVSLDTLSRAEYFGSFPQWLTLVSHLSNEDGALERVASDPDPALAATGAATAPEVALPPAVCYHFYERFADSIIDRKRLLTAQATCWRHEGDAMRPLERGWAFTMREVVCIGTADDVEDFRLRLMAKVGALAASLGLDGEIEIASDPFFAPTARGKALLQRVKSLKHELLLPIGGGKRIAAASFNNHETFFGERFGLRLPDGSPASTACVAFGLERWLLAVSSAIRRTSTAGPPRNLGERSRLRLLRATASHRAPKARPR